MSVIQAPEQVLCNYRRSLDAIQADPEFDDGDAAAINEWLTHNTSANVVAIELRRAGYKVSATAVKDHRRNECICAVNV